MFSVLLLVKKTIYLNAAVNLQQLTNTSSLKELSSQALQLPLLWASHAFAPIGGLDSLPTHSARGRDLNGVLPLFTTKPPSFLAFEVTLSFGIFSIDSLRGGFGKYMETTFHPVCRIKYQPGPKT